MAMLPNGQLRFAHGLLLAALLALGMQSDPLSAQTSDESKADDKKDKSPTVDGSFSDKSL